MRDWRKSVLNNNATLEDAMRKLQEFSIGLVLVVDSSNKLEGVISDGDIRRALLKKLPYETNVQEFFNSNPTVLGEDYTKKEAISILKEKVLNRLPIVNDRNIVTKLLFLEDLISGTQIKDEEIVIMAGGLGTRLGEMTKEIPKPMLPIKGKPILQRIIENARDQGFKKFHLAVKHKKEIIKDHFGDGSNLGVKINYLEEQDRLGTAGALGLIKNKTAKTYIVMNADLITEINLNNLINFHNEHRSAATMCVKKFEFEVPYGVVYTDSERITKLEEKPTQSFLVSAGIYALSSEVLDIIPGNSYFEMPEVFHTLIRQDKNTAAFPIHEYWIDVGQKKDFEKAEIDIEKLF